MHGFKLSKAHAAAQNFADGGMVGRIKGALGFKPADPEKEARIAAARAEYRAEKERAKQGAQPQAAAAPQKAITDYASGGALQRLMKEVDGYKNGGMVRGPGTGTSDEVPDEVPEGTYIMPADSTQAMGAGQLQGLGAKNIPVNLSNGEFKLPPEQVHAVGVQALDQMKDATHTPVAAQGEGPELFFAGGGQVRDPNRPDIPVVGTRGPVRGGGGGGLSQDAVAAAQNAQRIKMPAAAGIAGLTANPVTNPMAITRERERQAGNYAAGGVVKDEDERRNKPNFFPGNSPDAGANVYGGAGVELGSSGKLARGAESVIGAQPSMQQAPTGIPMASQNTDAQRQAMVNQIPRDTGPQAVAQPVRPAPVPAAPPRAAGWQSDLAAMQAMNTSPPVAARQPAQPSTSPSRLFAQDRANEITSQIGAGNYAGAVGTGVRTAVQGAGVYAAEAADRVVSPWLNAGGRFLGGALGTDTPQGQVMSSANAAPVPSAAAPAVPPPASPAGQRTPPTSAAPGQPPAEAPPQSAPAQVMPGVYQHGRGRYSDNASGMGMPAGFTGQPNAQNMAAAQALSDRGQQQALAQGFNPAQAANWQAPVVRNSTNDFASRKALENAATAASSITADGGRFDSRRGTGGGKSDQQILPPSSKQAAYAAMQSSDLALQNAQPGMDQAAMRERAADGRASMQTQAELQRTAMREDGENTRAGARNAMDGRRLGLDEKAAGYSTRQADRMEQLQNDYLAAQDDPKKAEGIAQKMRALSGKGADPANRFTVVAGGQEWDQQAGAMRNVPGRVLNNQTGQWVQEGPAPVQVPIGQNPKALAIKSDTKMTTEQKRAALAQLGY